MRSDSRRTSLMNLFHRRFLRHPSLGGLPRTPRPAYPGPQAFGPGRSNIAILLLRLKLTSAGYVEDLRTSPRNDSRILRLKVWDDSLRTACEEFQRAQGWHSDRANGYPCEETWRRLWRQ